METTGPWASAKGWMVGVMDKERREALLPGGVLWPRLLLVALAGVAAEALVRSAPLVSHSTWLRLLLAAVYLALGISVTGRARRQALRYVAQGPLQLSGIRNLVVHAAVVASYLLVVILAADILRVSLAGLAFGGAITGVVLGLAAQSTLGNLFAGLVLLLLRPYAPGQWVSLRSWYSSGIEYTGRVEELNLFYTVLADGSARRIIPNSAALVSYVTVAGDGQRRSFTTTLPRTLSLTALEEAVRRIAGEAPEVHVTAVGTDTYTATVVMPAGAAAAWEAVLAEFVRTAPQSAEDA
jgi:small conductance mechanosensitive channel